MTKQRATVTALREAQRQKFFVRGIAFAVASGICYGLYTGVLTLAETQGMWEAWFAGESWGANNPALSAFTIAFALAALASGVNDFASGIWSLLVCAKNRQLGDLAKTVRTKPGLVMIISAAIGGPLAGTAYIVALNAATAAGNPGVIVPIAALNCAIGAVLGRILFKQTLQAHKIAGILVCLVAAGLIGGASFASIGPEALMGCLFALLAAFGWGFEGCVAGFGTTLIDYRIGIAIRQCTSGLLELLVVFPVLAIIGGGVESVLQLAGAAFTDPSLVIFVISGLFAMPAFSFWYKGNSMCGTALGMACNGMYAFWGPFFIWVIMGALNIGGMAESYPPLSAIQWIGALIMVAGIFCIAASPAQLLKKRDAEETSKATDAASACTANENAPDASFPTDTDARKTDSPTDAVEPGSPTSVNRSTTGNAATTSTTATSLKPLYYAIMLHFMDNREHSAEDVMRALEPGYHTYKLFTHKDVEEALACAKENGLIDETRCDLDTRNDLRIFYQLNDFGRDMIARYIG